MVYLVVPVHNRIELLPQFVLQLRDQNVPFHLIVIDDGSTDGTSDYLRNHVPECSVLNGDGNLWWTGAVQMGILHLQTMGIDADSPMILLNDDVQLGPNYLKSATEFCERITDGVICATVHRDDGSIAYNGAKISWFNLKFLESSASQADCLGCRSVAARFHHFAQKGLFRPQIFPHYLGDYDFTLNWHRSGIRFHEHPDFWIRERAGYTGMHIDAQTHSFGEFLRGFGSLKWSGNPVGLIKFAWMNGKGLVKFSGVAFVILRTIYLAMRIVFLANKNPRPQA